eukprot:6197372-Pleurochrysis_carterae.AAC.1
MVYGNEQRALRSAGHPGPCSVGPRQRQAHAQAGSRLQASARAACFHHTLHERTPRTSLTVGLAAIPVYLSFNAGWTTAAFNRRCFRYQDIPASVKEQLGYATSDENSSRYLEHRQRALCLAASTPFHLPAEVEASAQLKMVSRRHQHAFSCTQRKGPKILWLWTRNPAVAFCACISGPSRLSRSTDEASRRAATTRTGSLSGTNLIGHIDGAAQAPSGALASTTTTDPTPELDEDVYDEA